MEEDKKDPGNSPPEEWTEPMPEEEAEEIRRMLAEEMTGGGN